MTSKKTLEQIRNDVNHARAWALKHFNVNGPDGFLDPPTADVEFPDVDRMIVCPTRFGKRLTVSIQYKLKWIDGFVGWEGLGIISGKPFTWLRATGPINIELLAERSEMIEISK